MLHKSCLNMTNTIYIFVYDKVQYLHNDRNLMKYLQKFSPFLTAVFFLMAFCAIIYTFIVKENGVFTYVLDDPYIHLAMAKNAAYYGILGITKFGFTSSTSSPAWSLLLTDCIKIFGNFSYIPLLMSSFFAIVSLLVFNIVLRNDFNNKYILILLTSLAALAAPLPALIFTGLEHTAHIVFAMLLLWTSTLYLSNPDKKQSIYKWVCLLAAVSTAFRYESAFMVFAVGVLLVLDRRYFRAVFLWISGAIAPIVFGFYSMSKGWFFLPNSLALKGNTDIFSSLSGFVNKIFYNWFKQLGENPHLMVLVFISALILFLMRNKTNSKAFIINLIYLASAILHLQLAQTGWFYRYEAYLVFLGIFSISASINDLKETNLYISLSEYFESYNRIQKSAVIFFIILFCSPLIHRGFESAGRIKQASSNIYNQQYTYSQFINKYYSGATLVLNDIGAANYYNNIKTVDLWGLASIETARMKKNGSYTTQSFAKLFEKTNPDIAIIYQDWFLGETQLPANWIKSGEWKITNNIVCGESTVSFFAPNIEKARKLETNLNEFASQMPKAIIIRTGLFPKEK